MEDAKAKGLPPGPMLVPGLCYSRGHLAPQDHEPRITAHSAPYNISNACSRVDKIDKIVLNYRGLNIDVSNHRGTNFRPISIPIKYMENGE